MAELRVGTSQEAAYLADLVEAGLLIECEVPGVYGRNATFEEVRTGVDDLVSRHAALDGAEQLRFPPVLPRRQLERAGYLRSFPHLAGSVFGFSGSEREAAELSARADAHADWSDLQVQTDLVLTPAACYPVYPAIAKRGPLPPGGVTVDAGGAYVFRSEPSGDPARLQMFHQREIVRIGEPEAVGEWRDAWRDRAIGLLRALGLAAELDVATDPFFGRRGRMLATSQREQALKFEVLVPIASPSPTAVASFNYHQDHFASAYDVRLAGGGVAHTACLGFGLERVALALLRAHGLEPHAWPDAVREELWGA
ncbi:MAG: amino acid--[acyl-carrier-protein] ligase [Solirubrobacteraceae bacterium]